jgi:mxaL protein
LKHRLTFWWKRLLIRLRHQWQNGTLFFMLAAMALLPVWFEPHTQQDSTVQDTLFVIDISESMNVRDVDYPRPHSDRLGLAKATVREAMSVLPCGSRMSVGLFAGDETVVLFEPLEVCRHYPAIEQVVMRLESRMRWIGDSWVIRALVSAIKEADKRKMNLMMITDADEMPHHSAPRLTDLLEYKGKVKGLLVGVGGEAPQPVPRLGGALIDGRQQITGYWTPEEAVIEGNHPNLLAYVKELPPGEQAPPGMLDEVGEHLSVFNRALLQACAEAADFDTAHIHHPQEIIKPLLQNKFQGSALAERDARWIFGLAAALLVLAGWFRQKVKHIA